MTGFGELWQASMLLKKDKESRGRDVSVEEKVRLCQVCTDFWQQQQEGADGNGSGGGPAVGDLVEAGLRRRGELVRC